MPESAYFWRKRRYATESKIPGAVGCNANSPLREQIKLVIFPPMHFSTHIAILHSTFSLLAALLLRGAR